MSNPSQPSYLDACAVAGWCCSIVAQGSPIDVACGIAIDALLARPDAVVGVSELTVLETHDVLSKLLRSTHLADFDAEWFEQAMNRLMTLLADSRVQVVEPPPKVAEHAMVLVRVASVEHGAKLKAWDAVHIITAAHWARSLGQRVAVVTADQDFRRFFELQGHFNALLDLEEVAV